MSQGQIQSKQAFTLKFTDDQAQKMALVIFCKKPSLASILAKSFDIEFDGAVHGQQHKSQVSAIRYWGPAGCDDKLKKALDALVSDYKERKHFSKELIAEIADQINLTGSYMRKQFHAANQNGSKGGRSGAYVFKPRRPAQGDLWKLIEKEDVTFAIGPAGTGKTHVAVACAVAALEAGKIEKIILARPNAPSGKDPGALPGDMMQKLAPYMRPLYDELNEVLGPQKMKKYLEDGTIEIAPVEMMRGRTFKKAFVIVDEAQNCTKEQTRMALTRIGEGSKMVIAGDPMQVDLKDKSDSGLKWAYERLEGKKYIGVQYFASADIVRHEVVQVIVEALDDNNQANPGAKPAVASAPQRPQKAPGQG